MSTTEKLSIKPEKNTSTTSLKEKLSSALISCRICLSSVFEPACLTNCGHSFCEECLNTYWQVNDKPELITCPLCRGQASDITFVMKDDASSTEDFRKTFNKSLMSVHYLSIFSSLCLKMMMLPALYWICNWLKAPMVQIVSYFQTGILKLDQ